MPKHLVKGRLERVRQRLLAGDLDLTALNEVMTAAELARLIDSSVSSVTQNLWRLRIPHRRLGARLLFSRVAIVDWLTRGIQDARSAEQTNLSEPGDANTDAG